jgi:indolepyruvate ferredoxin oxidoreductase
MMTAFHWLSRLKVLRGTVFDPFRNTQERQMERQLLADYEDDVELLLAQLKPEALATAVELARVPEQVRGFGHVKAASVSQAHSRRTLLRAQLLAATGAPASAP